MDSRGKAGVRFSLSLYLPEIDKETQTIPSYIFIASATRGSLK